jgi:NDP-sugar pyrophosphorylase family protein
MKAGILAAGDGSRLAKAGISTPKPLVKVGGMSLIERTMRALVDSGVDEIALIVNENMAGVAAEVERFRLPVPVRAVIRSTPSSMHSLHELASQLGKQRFVLCTVDSIMRSDEFRAFIRQYEMHPEIDVLLSYTDFVDDENPLRVAVDGHERIVGLGQAAASSPYVTLGLYGMSPSIFPILDRAVVEGVHRLRNFLGRVLEEGFSMSGRRISKGIDVDRPEDVQVAEAFLREEGVGA